MTLIPFAITFLISLAVSWLLLPRIISWSHRIDFLDYPGQHKRHKQPVPPSGGIVLFIVFWVTVIPSIFLFYDSFKEILPSVGYIFMGALIILLIGLADDIRPMPAWIKLLAQVAAGLVLSFGGLGSEFLTIPFSSVEIGNYSVLITIIWVVMLTNAINLIDGLDGLAGGVSLIGAVTIILIGWLYDVGAVLVFMIILAGYLVVFLWYNRHPARIFLGDSGSMQVGFYFAVFSLLFPLKSYTVSALYLPLLALGVPILEVVTSFSRRLVSGKNIMRADRRHLFHYLALFGLSPKKTVYVFYGLSVVYGAAAVAMFYWDRVLVFMLLIVFMVVIFTIFYILLIKFGRVKKTLGRN